MKRMGFASVLSAVVSVGLVVACGGDDFDSCEANNDCGTGGTDGGTGATGGTGGTSGTGGTGNTGGSGGQGGATGGSGGDAGSCDTSKSPSEEACLVGDQHAVFVNGTSATSGTGTKSSPFKTIAEALSAAGGKMILVCNTNYDEHVKVTAGNQLYGGFACADWTYETGKRATVKPTAKGFALEIDSVTAKVVLEDMEFVSADGTAAGDSSVAAFVHGSTDVKFSRVKLAAGKGVTGANGTLSTFPYPTQTSLNGNNANLTAGGAEKKCTCPGGALTTGGIGGTATTGGQAGGKGTPDMGGGLAGQPGACSPNGTGGDGKPGTSPVDATGASTVGTVAAGGWTPSAGATGTAGGPGQGGGGGASSVTGGGGGGGCGGCGGAGGPGGGGGGASIALLVLDSTVNVGVGSELVTLDAGGGGKGVAGQTGQTDVGFGGLQAVGACSGGSGAAGGTGAAGGGGAGGISVAIVWKGTGAPNVDGGAKYTLGKKGLKGDGGKAGSNDGIDGLSQQSLEVK